MLMSEDGKVVYKVVVDADNAEKEAEESGQRVGKEFGDGIEEGSKSGTSKYEEIWIGASRRVGEAIVNMAMTAGKKLKDFALDSIELASDLQEVQNVVDVTFGDGASQINDWAKGAAEAYGLSELSALKYTSTIGAMFKSMGLGQKDIESMSTGIAGLAGDMASFYNLEPEVAFEKLRAGISGETEPLKQLGINMSVANLEAYALSQGIETAYNEMSQAEQATLRYQYIMQATADAQGDFANTSDSLANQQRILQLEVETLSAQFGEALMPAAQTVVGALREIVTWARENGTTLELLGIIVGTLTVAILAYNASLALAASGMTIGSIAAGAFGAAVSFLTSPITLVVVAIGALVAAGVLLVKHWDEVKTFFTNMWNKVKEIFTNAVDKISDGLSSWWTKVKEWFKNAIESIIGFFKDPDWAGIGKAIVEGIWNGIKGMWDWLTKSVSDAVTGLWNGAKKVLGIQSPSKKFKYLGEMSVKGMEEGFSDYAPILNRKVFTTFENVGAVAEAGLSGSVLRIPSTSEASRAIKLDIAGKSNGRPVQINTSVQLNGREIARATAWNMGEQLAWEEMS